MADNESKVEPFLLLAKNARGLALVDLIGKCTAEPGLFTFGEILSLPGVQEVRWHNRRGVLPFAAAAATAAAAAALSSLRSPPDLLVHPVPLTPMSSCGRAQSTRQRTSCCSCMPTAPGTTTKVRGCCAPGRREFRKQVPACTALHAAMWQSPGPILGLPADCPLRTCP